MRNRTTMWFIIFSIFVMGLPFLSQATDCKMRIDDAVQFCHHKIEQEKKIPMVEKRTHWTRYKTNIDSLNSPYPIKFRWEKTQYYLMDLYINSVLFPIYLPYYLGIRGKEKSSCVRYLDQKVKEYRDDYLKEEGNELKKLYFAQCMTGSKRIIVYQDHRSNVMAAFSFSRKKHIGFPLERGEGVCRDYAPIFNEIASILGLESYPIMGHHHVLNTVKMDIGNGKGKMWYLVEPQKMPGYVIHFKKENSWKN